MVACVGATTQTLSVPSRLARKATVRSNVSASAPIADKLLDRALQRLSQFVVPSSPKAIQLVRMHIFPSSRIV